MKWQLFTGDGLQVGWTEIQPDTNIWVNSGPFHPNDFYSLIRPIMFDERWTKDITIGEIIDNGWEEDFIHSSDAIDALELYLRESETGKRVELSFI